MGHRLNSLGAGTEMASEQAEGVNTFESRGGKLDQAEGKVELPSKPNKTPAHP